MQGIGAMEMTPPLRFERLEGVARWSRPRRLDFFDRLPTAPIADSEVLNLAHHCPIVLVSGPRGPRVAVLLDSRLARSDPLGKDGAWRFPYCPMALRCLPFWPGQRPSDVDIAVDIALRHPEASLPLREPSGEPSNAFAAVMTLVERLREGMARLDAAANLLLAADLLVPIAWHDDDGSPEATAYLTVAEDRVLGLSPARAAALAELRCLPLELATACLFSQRHLAARAKPWSDAAGSSRMPPPRAAEGGVDMLEPHMALDQSPLFSFDVLAHLDASMHEAV
jgi:hypothetical protein